MSTKITIYQYKYLIIFPVNEGQFELVLSWVNGEHPCLTLPIQTVHVAPLHCCDVDGQVQRTNYTMVARERGGGVDKCCHPL